MPFFFKEATEFTSANGTVRFNDPSDMGDYVADQCWLDKLDGWTKTVSPVVVTSQKAVGDGASIAKKFYSQGRVLMASGIVATDTELETEQAWHNLVRLAFPLNKIVRITHFGPVPTYGDFRVISDVRPTEFMPLGFRFEVDLMSSQSYLYDALDNLLGTAGIVGNSTGGMVFPLTFPLDFNGTPGGESNLITLNNIGTAPTKPVVTVTGPLDTGWRLENTTTGKFIAFDVSLADGQVMVIDFQKESATISGTSVSGLVDGDWWDIEPGLNTIKLFGNYYPTASFTVLAKSAWR